MYAASSCFACFYKPFECCNCMQRLHLLFNNYRLAKLHFAIELLSHRSVHI